MGISLDKKALLAMVAMVAMAVAIAELLDLLVPVAFAVTLEVSATKISLEAATSTKTTTVTVGGEVTFAAAATANQNDIAELAVCFATEKDKHYFCALGSFQQITN